MARKATNPRLVPVRPSADDPADAEALEFAGVDDLDRELGGFIQEHRSFRGSEGSMSSDELLFA